MPNKRLESHAVLYICIVITTYTVYCIEPQCLVVLGRTALLTNHGVAAARTHDREEGWDKCFFLVDMIEVRKRAIGRIRSYNLQQGPIILEK